MADRNREICDCRIRRIRVKIFKKYKQQLVLCGKWAEEIKEIWENGSTC